MSPISSRKQAAAGGLLELARRAPAPPGESATLVTEQLALDQLARMARHVERHERSLAALAVVVQGARDQFLAGADSPVTITVRSVAMRRAKAR